MKKVWFRPWAASVFLLFFSPLRSQNASADAFRLEFAPIHGQAPSGGNIFARDFLPSGPVTGVRLIPGMKVIPTNGRTKFYGVFYHEFHEIDAASGGIKRITLPEGLSSPTSLTLDAGRNRV